MLKPRIFSGVQLVSRRKFGNSLTKCKLVENEPWSTVFYDTTYAWNGS